MKNKLRRVALYFILFLAPIGLSAQNDSISPRVKAPNAEAPHALFTLGDEREIRYDPVRTTPNTFRFEFAYESRWRGSQIFLCLSEMPLPYQIKINHFKLSQVF